MTFQRIASTKCWLLSLEWRPELGSIRQVLGCLVRQGSDRGGDGAGVESVWLELRHCHCLRNEMAHFCTDLQTYIMFEVLETAWHIFMRQLQVTAPKALTDTFTVQSMLIMCNLPLGSRVNSSTFCTYMQRICCSFDHICLPCCHVP